MHYASCLIPSHLTNLASSSESSKLLSNRLVYLKVLPAKTGGKALSRFFGFIFNCVKEEPEKNTASFNFNYLMIVSEHKQLCDVLMDKLMWKGGLV